MKHLLSLAAAAVLMFGSAHASVAAPGQSASEADICQIAAETIAKSSPDDLKEGDVLIGRVNNVDVQKSIVTLETPVGVLEVALPPDEMRDLNEGDLITVVYMGEETDPSQEAEQIVI